MIKINWPTTTIVAEMLSPSVNNASAQKNNITAGRNVDVFFS